MDFVKSFNGKMIDVGDCMGCAIVNNFENTNNYAGQVARTKNFTIAQDFELPINGFMVISSVRHLESINKMTLEEKQELITLIDVVISSLKKLGVCNQYNVVWEEKDGNHFHVWLMPRHKYLVEAMGTNIMKKVGEMFAYAKENLRTEENLKQVFATIDNLKIELKQNETVKNIIL
jgi:diadenosine tetraphosphate (Ap4A) HIT family hydrolase